jgi:hypothetical protein
MLSRNKKQTTGEVLKEWRISIPVKNCDYSENQDGNFVLKTPKSDNAVLQKVITFISKKPHFKFKLDNYGSFIWKNCDGKKSVGKISKLLEREFGESVRPTEDRTILFLKSLYQHQLIKFFKENSS